MVLFIGVIVVVQRFSLGSIEHQRRPSRLFSPTGYDNPSQVSTTSEAGIDVRLLFRYSRKGVSGRTPSKFGR